jgi:hypothetical protein
MPRFVSPIWYSERLDRRRGVWFRRLAPWWRREHNPFHYLREQNTLLTAGDADDRWRCCRLWQRKLFNKWNIREFARRHGCRVPELLWHGTNPDGIPFEALPEHYVVRATRGQERRNTLAISRGINLLDRSPYGPEDVRACCREWLSACRRSPVNRILIEEFVRTEDGRVELPYDHRVHVFGDRIGVVSITDIRGATGAARGARVDRARTRESAFDGDWKPLNGVLRPRVIHAADLPVPRCSDEMLHFARTLGLAVESYVRVDTYATPRGAVVGELAMLPGGIAEWANRHLGALWDEWIPDRI